LSQRHIFPPKDSFWFLLQGVEEEEILVIIIEPKKGLKKVVGVVTHPGFSPESTTDVYADTHI